MEENLVGYLLNALEPEEQTAVETQLQTSENLRLRLEQLRGALAPLSADREGPEPPAGLALGAIARVAEHRCRRLPPAPRPANVDRAGPNVGWRWVRHADMLAAACLLFLIGGMTLPAIFQAWTVRDRVACADNLRSFWSSLQSYSSQKADGSFPKVADEGALATAAAFVPLLHDAGSFGDGATVSVACPAIGKRTPPAITVSDLEDAYTRGGDAYGSLARQLGGDYAYSLGYRDGNVLFGLNANSGDDLPILADRTAGPGNSPNHGGIGQNVLYIGGNVRWCNSRTVGVQGDDIYVNKHNLLRAGEGRFDTVLGPGDAQPGKID